MDVKDLLQAIRTRDIRYKMETGEFFLGDGERATLQKFLETMPNGKYEECSTCKRNSFPTIDKALTSKKA